MGCTLRIIAVFLFLFVGFSTHLSAVPRKIPLDDPALSYISVQSSAITKKLACFSFRGTVGLAFVKRKTLKPTTARRRRIVSIIRGQSEKSFSKAKIDSLKLELRTLRKTKKGCSQSIDSPTPTSGLPTNISFPAELLNFKNRFDSRMTRFGREYCRFLASNESFDPLLAATFYDAPWVFLQLQNYTGDSFWKRCTKRALIVYRDRYVLANNGFIPGFWLFPHGLAEDYLQNGNSKSKRALKSLRDNGAFARTNTPLSETRHSDFSREVAYVIMTYLEAEKVGFTPPARLYDMIEHALLHLSDWTNGRAPYVRPFMVALTTQALIQAYDRTGDPRIPGAIKSGLDYIWSTCWDSSANAFQYTDRNVSDGGTELAPDLNLLIAPAFAWYFQYSGNATYYDRAIDIYKGGITDAYLGNPKQFNQNYRWSFQGLVWLSNK